MAAGCLRASVDGWPAKGGSSLWSGVTPVSSHSSRPGSNAFIRSADHQDLDRFAAELADARTRLGPILLAVLWVRSCAPQSLLAAAEAVAPGGRVVRVVGSSASAASDESAETIRRRFGSGYQEVRLGAVATSAGPRWLTEAEISDGVHKAIESGAGDVLVGNHRASEQR